MPPAADSTNATERAYQAVLGWIESRDLVPGSVLDERRLADALEVSRTPLRNAISRLHGEGYVVRLSNGSMVVRDIGSGEVLELLLVRRLLETEAAALAAGRIPDQLIRALSERLRGLANAGTDSDAWRAGDEVHDLIAQHCGNRSLAGLIQEVRRRIRMSSIERVPGRGVRASAEHLAIVDALAAGDGNAARATMGVHLDNIRDGFLAAFGFGTRHAAD